MLGELRAELSGLQQRHASLASSSTAEHAAHRQATATLHSSVDAMAMQTEAMQRAVGGLQANEAAASATSEKLKKAAKRHVFLPEHPCLKEPIAWLCRKTVVSPAIEWKS